MTENTLTNVYIYLFETKFIETINTAAVRHTVVRVARLSS